MSRTKSGVGFHAVAESSSRKNTIKTAPTGDGRQFAKTDRRLVKNTAKRLSILDAALSVFSQSGFSGAAVEQIAELAGVSKANLFYYFESKEQIYVSLLQRLLDGWLAPLQEIEIDDDPGEAIRRYIRLKLEFSRSNPEASRLFCLEIVQGAPLIGTYLRTTLRDLVDAKAGIIGAWSDMQKIRAIDPYHLIFTIWSITQHYADFSVQVEAVLKKDLRDEYFFENTIAYIQDLVMNGIAIRDDREK